MIGCVADIRLSGKIDTKYMYMAHRIFDGILGREYSKYDIFLHVAVPREEACKIRNGESTIYT